MRGWSNLAKIITRRTYSRTDNPLTNGAPENWNQIIEREVMGNVKGRNVSKEEVKHLLRLGKDRKAIPAGRGLWFSGTDAHTRLGGVALNNCWFVTADHWNNFVIAADLLMLGGGVGGSVEQRYVSKLPKVKRDVRVIHKATKDADYIIPDSREGWCQAIHRALEAFFVTGKSFTYSTVCLRGKGEPIKSFGGVSSGPIPLIQFFDNLNIILGGRSGKHIRPIDAADIITATGEVVVSGNVRRSAILLMGDAWDKEFLTAKRWDLDTLPSYRSCANYSVVCEDADDLHPLFWKTFEAGEAYGIVNRKAIQKFGRIGELKKDSAEGANPCAEATLEPFEPCNLSEIALPNLDSEDEFILAARLMHRYGKRATMEKFHHEQIQEVVNRNRRVGTGITGCLASPLFDPRVLDRAYQAIQEENVSYSKELGIPESIRTTVIKPSGTVSKVLDMDGYEGIHPAYSRYIIQRVRFAANDQLVPLLREAGHYMEPIRKLDGTMDLNTLVVDFYVQAPVGSPVADENYSTWDQLKDVQMAQRHWADQSVSVSVYYKREDISKIKTWLADNIKNLKTISFLAHAEHGFAQAPKEKITAEQFEKLSSDIKPIDFERIGSGDIDSGECATGVCPVK